MSSAALALNVTNQLNDHAFEDNPLWSLWKERLDHLDFALQPIVHIHSGEIFAVEALLRKTDQLGFGGPSSLFDSLSKEQLLFRGDLMLREKAIQKFVSLPNHQGLRLFYNLDKRMIDSPGHRSGATDSLLSQYHLAHHNVCFEISERQELSSSQQASRVLNHYKKQGYSIALDDFGSGSAGLQLLFVSRPSFLKIDRFFMAQICQNPKKKLFVAKMVNLAHLMGIKVIAEGVETEAEYFVCREVGCDFAQGFLVGPPSLDTKQIGQTSSLVSLLVQQDRRRAKGSWLLEQLDPLPVVSIHSSMLQVLDLFRKHKSLSFFPVIDEQEHPVGLLCEEDLKSYVYSPFGRELMQNKSAGITVSNFINNCPQAADNAPIDELLEIYSLSEGAKGLLITSEGKYIGFLSSNRLLKLLSERSIALARDQNPLTGLPGNHRIGRYLQDTCLANCPDLMLVYFDFDHFKPFNDKQGFRAGDRAILLFAELLSKHLSESASLIGHIGGDDFFAAFKSSDYQKIYQLIGVVCQTFANDVESFYDPEDRENGYIEAKDRDGNRGKFKLLRVSAAILEVKGGSSGVTLERISAATAILKKGAKGAETGLIGASLLP